MEQAFMLLIILLFYLEYIHDIRIRTAKPHLAITGQRRLSAVSQYVDIWERHVHCHGAQFATFRVKIECVSGFVAAVAHAFAFALN